MFISARMSIFPFFHLPYCQIPDYIIPESTKTDAARSWPPGSASLHFQVVPVVSMCGFHHGNRVLAADIVWFPRACPPAHATDSANTIPSTIHPYPYLSWLGRWPPPRGWCCHVALTTIEGGKVWTVFKFVCLWVWSLFNKPFILMVYSLVRWLTETIWQ